MVCLGPTGPWLLTFFYETLGFLLASVSKEVMP
jgi:hypothetical protein